MFFERQLFSVFDVLNKKKKVFESAAEHMTLEKNKEALQNFKEDEKEEEKFFFEQEEPARKVTELPYLLPGTRLALGRVKQNVIQERVPDFPILINCSLLF